MRILFPSAERFLTRISLLIFILLQTAFGFAQRPDNSERVGLALKGRIMDSFTNKPIEFATVAVYQLSNNKLISGIASDEKGNFLVPNIPSNDIYLTVTFMGYTTLRVDQIPAPQQGVVNLKSLNLASASHELKGVDIVASTKSVDYQLDKKVIDVASQITSASATAIEVLENVPSVKVDVDGTVSLRGSTGFTVLIDGKPTPMESSDALRSLPASSIQKIEIITNPSAKYQPDGTAGIVNVIMKKNRSNGMNGIVNANAGRFDTYGGDFLINYRANKLNYNLGADYNKRSSPGVSESERVVANTDTVNATSSGDRNHDHIMKSIKGGIDYDLSVYDAISLGFRIGQRDMTNSGNQIYQESRLPSNVFDQYSTNNNSTRGGSFGSVNTTYLHKFANNTDHTIKLSADYNRSSGDERSLSEQKDNNSNLTDGKINSSTTKRTNFQGGVDYVLPLNDKSKLEAGYLGRYEDISQQTTMDTLTLATLIYAGNTKYDNTSKNNQKIHALYSMLSSQIASLSYQVGLRGEYTNRLITTNNATNSFTLNQWDYFPSVHLSYKLPHEHELALSYSRRIERTRGWDLDPFVVWVDAYNVRQGNPALKNQYIDAYELGYMKQYKPFYLSLEGYYRITNNKVERIKTVYQDNVVLQSPYNVGNDYTLGVEGSINSKLFKFWDLNLMGSTSDYRIKGELNGTSFDNHSFNWNGRLNNTFAITKNQQIQLNGNYTSKTVTSQGYNSAYFAFDGAYRIDFMEKKFSLVAQVRDIFGTAIRESYTETPTIYAHDWSKNKTPQITVTATYRINNYKQKRPSSNQNPDTSEE